MKIVKMSLPIAIAMMIVSCGETQEKNVTETETAEVVEAEMAEEVAPALNVDSMVKVISATRLSIEGAVTEPVVVSTADLRAKVKQKWDKIHFYMMNDEVVKIKTYPYASISNRTEEFYLENGQVVLAVIEDDGSGEKGKAIEEIDKLYYFNNNELIKEVRGEKEAEYAIKNSEAEELLSEVTEYLEILANQPK